MRAPGRCRAGRRTGAPVRRLVARWVLVGLLAAAGLALGTATASAHAVLERTDPPDDAVLARLPAAVSLTFGESVQLPPHAIRVYDPSGAEVDVGAGGHPGGAPATVGTSLRADPAAGSYTVAWRVISADTHPVSGAFVFSVGHPSSTAAPAPPPGGSLAVGVLYGIVRAVAFAAYAAMVGAAAVLLVCWPAAPVPSTALTALRAGWSGLLLSTVATVLLQGPYGNGTGLGDAFDPGVVAATLQLPLGSALAARLLLLAGFAFYLGRLTHAVRRGAGARWRRWLVVVGLVLVVELAATWSAAGHAAVGLQPWLALPVDVAHITAMGVWLGGVATLALALWSGGRDRYPDALAVAFRRFSRLAQACVAVIVASGVYQAWRQLGSWAALTGTAYGRLLDVKLLAVATILTAAAFSRRAVAVPRTGGDPATPPHWRPLRRALLVEVSGAVLVIAVTAVLVNAEPGRTALARQPSGPVHTTATFDTGGPAGRGSLEITLTPGRPGPNALDVLVEGPDGTPRDVPEVDAALSLPHRGVGPLRIPVTRAGPGHYTGHPQVPLPGDWQLDLTVRTSDFDETTVPIPAAVR
jgi:copper transport protein